MRPAMITSGRPRRGPAAAVVLAATLALAPTASAAVRYASPGGSSSNPGDSADRPWSLAKANASLVAGDLCVLLPGTYGAAISPASSGAAGARITYVGDLADPTRVTVTSITLTRSWITVKGVHATGGAELAYPARYDSVAYCSFRSLAVHAAKYSMIARNRVRGSVAFLANDGRPCYGGQTFDPGCIANSEYDTLRANDIDLGIMGPGARSFQIRAFTNHCVFDSNLVVGTFDTRGSSSPEGSIAFVGYNSHANTFRDNKWVLEATSAPPINTLWNGIYLRDSVTHTLFERDTMLLGVNSSHGIRGMLTSSGSFPGSVSDNRWVNCYYKTNTYFYAQDRFRNSTIENSVFASRSGNALWFSSITNSAFRHNVFYSGSQCIRFEGSFAGTNEISSNIFYSANAGGIGNGGSQTQFERNATTGFTSNHNLFFTPTFTSVPGDRSLMWCCYTGSRPGAGTPWHNLNGQDGNSRYGSPRFADSTFAGLDPRLREGSHAIGAGAGGTDAGPIPFAPAGPDVTPPAVVTDLAVAQLMDNAVDLRWTAPGDDGARGTAAAYDLRWSLSPIDDGSFAGAARVATQPIPLPAGGQQRYLMTGLGPGVAYWFALKARDAAGNWSGLSNVLGVTTMSSDVTPPAAIKDLSTSP